jgi:hypothetical protein
MLPAATATEAPPTTPLTIAIAVENAIAELLWPVGRPMFAKAPAASSWAERRNRVDRSPATST